MGGLVAYGAYLPHNRLDRRRIKEVLGAGGDKRTRAVASYDEDTTSMGVAADLAALRGVDDRRVISQLFFATATPSHLDKTNATAVHAASRLPAEALAVDMVGAVRSGVGVLVAASQSPVATMTVLSDVRTGFAGRSRRHPRLLLEGISDSHVDRRSRQLRSIGRNQMSSHGIRDQVAIVGMGCTAFGEEWGKSTDDLLIESSAAAAASAGITLEEVDAFWLGTMGSGTSGLTLSRPLRLPYKPVTRLENMCATGSEALRNACYAVACGAYDSAMAIGVEKLKDSGYSGLVSTPLPGAGDEGRGETSAPANFSLLAPAYAEKYGVDLDEMKEVLTRIAWKNHQNGAKNSRAQYRKPVSMDTIRNSPKVAGMLGVFDCSGVSDGSAAAIVVRAEDAYRYTDKPLFVKALSFVAGPSLGLVNSDYDFTTFPEVAACAEDAYRLMFEAWLQLRGEAPAERRLRSIAEGRTMALTHNLGGGAGDCVSFASVVGIERSE
jgi:acetyl-CoA acetyltransferase